MRFSEIIKWQWEGYSKFHQSRKNLLIHIVFVPLFVIGFASFLLSLLWCDLSSALSSLFIMALSFGLQGMGHSKEIHPAEPFTSFKNAVIRIVLEQFYTFPKFVFTGRWYRAFQDPEL
ncbi:terminase [Pseudoalteromonas arctica]|uniref:Terminase n=1 Tax=Pseudoalteromonas arctica TaxID=394751 RepID=A0A7Y0DPT6_9GAMM|nr:terminase [Pseudoalteromonas arctica]NMM39420.1 terminase [Pseudoalteromonas arctica]